jgi:hypothetical protein
LNGHRHNPRIWDTLENLAGLPEENIHRPYIHRHTPQNWGLSIFTPRQPRENQRNVLGGKLGARTRILPVDNIHRHHLHRHNIQLLALPYSEKA